MIRLLLGIFILLQASCNGNNNSKNRGNNSDNIKIEDIHLLTQQKPQNDYMEALLSSKPELLSIDSNGCLKIKNYTIIWPYGFKLIENNNKVAILNDQGNFVVNIGDKVQVSGGECANCSGEEIKKIIGSTSKNNCSGIFWIVGGEIKTK